ncbi:MAG TPA: sugar ABC transporter permease [Gaiellaceae bacterium]|nr:sugar ABC transporter permease [Gaiellaceae bacterium]
MRWLVFLAPAAALTGLFLVYPVVATIRLSFYNWSGYGKQQYAGTSNFRQLYRDHDAVTATVHSLEFAVVTTVVTVGMGAILALAIDRKIRGHRIFQFALFLPVLLPSTFLALVWAYGLDPISGWFTHFLQFLGIGSGNWLADPHYGIFAVALAYILQNTGFAMIIILAALSDISPEIHEAATLDGVGQLRRARKVSLPLVRDAIVTVSLLQLIYGFTNFDFVYAMVNGGPGTGTDVVSTFVYYQAFVSHRFGYGAAAALVASGVVALIAMVFMSVFRPRGIRRAG